MFEISTEFTYCRHIVMGLGTVSNDCVEHLHEANIVDVHFVCLSQDESRINESSTFTRIEFDYRYFSREKSASSATLKVRHSIKKILGPTDSLFLVIDIRDSAAIEAALAIVQLAKGEGLYFIVVVTTSVSDENREAVADDNIKHLLSDITALINIPAYEHLMLSNNKQNTRDSFKVVSSTLENAVSAMLNFNNNLTLINQSMKEVRETMSGMGKASVASACAVGENRVKVATRNALRHFAMINASSKIVNNIFVNITAGSNMSLNEFGLVGEMIYDHIPDNIKSFIGATIDPDLDDEMKITIIANGKLSKTSVSTIAWT